MVLATNLGFPRIGADRELKKAVEAYWKGKSSQEDLLNTAQELRQKHWKLQKQAGLDHIPCNDFSFYDHILDMIATLGCIPSRYNWQGKDEQVDLDLYFAMARGKQEGDQDVTAMEMTKWFDTNYHYIVPEFEQDQEFSLSSSKVFDEFIEAKEQGVKARPVIIGPASFVFLGKAKYEGFNPPEIVEKLIPIYIEILQKLKDLGAEWVQIDEPMLAMDICDGAHDVFKNTYAKIKEAVPDLKILLTTYFEAMHENMQTAFSLPVDGIHLDLVRAPEQYKEALELISENMVLSLGLIDGRNIWKNNISASFQVAENICNKIGPERVMIGPSCSLLHSPVDLESETDLDPVVKNWMAFASQKIKEIAHIAKGLEKGPEAIADVIEDSDKIQQERSTSTRIHNGDVKARMSAITSEMKKRQNPFSARQKEQRANLGLPLFPTTSIGSFPQTNDIRVARAAFKRGELSKAQYQEAMQEEIRRVIAYQEEIDMDVLVHGEAERNDMVEYFGEQLEGFVFTKKGWVQSYGSRCVKPPIIFGDISRPNAMTVDWITYAQSQTEKVMKGMLTGPITILQWSFVRDDQPRSTTSRQIALAIRDEVEDLEKAGIKIIQIDEAAIREGLPLRKQDWQNYLDNAVEDFRIASCVVQDATQIHTHMCYSEFNDIIDSIGRMDADVISIETSRSQMKLLDAFAAYKYPNEIGPGVYDIHSPRIPQVEEMVSLLEKAEKVLAKDQIWVNPDCGLKTRGWEEVKPALENMSKAAKIMREKHNATQAA